MRGYSHLPWLSDDRNERLLQLVSLSYSVSQGDARVSPQLLPPPSPVRWRNQPTVATCALACIHPSVGSLSSSDPPSPSEAGSAPERDVSAREGEIARDQGTRDETATGERKGISRQILSCVTVLPLRHPSASQAMARGRKRGRERSLTLTQLLVSCSKSRHTNTNTQSSLADGQQHQRDSCCQPELPVVKTQGSEREELRKGRKEGRRKGHASACGSQSQLK